VNPRVKRTAFSTALLIETDHTGKLHIRHGRLYARRTMAERIFLAHVRPSVLGPGLQMNIRRRLGTLRKRSR